MWQRLAGLLFLGFAAAVQFDDLPAEWQLYPKSERLIRKAGDTVELRCHPRLKHEQKIVWKFKKCIEETSEIPCLELSRKSHDGWLNVNCGKKWCRGNLVLSNITQEDSGVYQCFPMNSHNNKTSHKRTIVTYILEVIENAYPPKILEVSPENITVIEGSRVMFHCRALSNIFAEFRWVRKYDNSSNSQAINYQNDKYEPIKSSGHIAVTEDTYLSKLVLTNARQEDTRDYICIVANSRGFDFREVHLSVLPRNRIGFAVHKGSDSSLHLLFLIPVIMVLLPTAVWFFYTHWRKRRKQNEMDPQIIHHPETVHYDNSSPPLKSSKDYQNVIKYHVVETRALQSHIAKGSPDWKQFSADR